MALPDDLRAHVTHPRDEIDWALERIESVLGV